MNMCASKSLWYHSEDSVLCITVYRSKLGEWDSDCLNESKKDLSLNGSYA